MFHTKVDLKLGFNNVGVDEDSKPLLTFEYNGYFFQYQVMPLGISSGPFTFDSWAKEFSTVVQFYVVSKIRYYQDDFILNDSDPLRLFHSTLLFCFLLMYCARALINWEILPAIKSKEQRPHDQLRLVSFAPSLDSPSAATPAFRVCQVFRKTFEKDQRKDNFVSVAWYRDS